MAALCELLAAALVEKDTNGDVLWVWSYPSVTNEQRDFLTEKIGLTKSQDAVTGFVYLHWQHTWYYILTTEAEGSPSTQKVTHFSIILTTKDFNPEKYEALSKLLSQQYKKTGNPAHMLEHYLSVITKGTCNNEENGKFSVIDFDSRQAFANSQVKSIIQTHGAETILLYTAMLLKKRIAVYFPRHSITDLLSFTRSLPAFVWHRHNWDVVYPFLNLTEKEVSCLKHINHYVVGFTEAEIEGRSDLYDIFVNGPADQITVSSQAKEYFTLGKLHKDISMLMIESAENPENTDQDVIKDIVKKTKELLTNLKSLASDDGSGNVYITLESLRERRMPPARETFLYNLAACEGLVKL